MPKPYIYNKMRYSSHINTDANRPPELDLKIYQQLNIKGADTNAALKQSTLTFYCLYCCSYYHVSIIRMARKFHNVTQIQIGHSESSCDLNPTTEVDSIRLRIAFGNYNHYLFSLIKSNRFYFKINM